MKSHPKDKSPLARYIDAKAAQYEPTARLTSEGWELSCQRNANRDLTGLEYTPGAIDEMQRSILATLRAGTCLPEEMRQDLVYAFEQLTVGIVPDILRPPKYDGARSDPVIGKLKIPAARYLQWVADGLIQQAKAEAVVASAYGVTTKTATNWRRDIEPGPIPDDPSPAEREDVQRFMMASGKAYQAVRRRKRLAGK